MNASTPRADRGRRLSWVLLVVAVVLLVVGGVTTFGSSNPGTPPPPSAAAPGGPAVGITSPGAEATTPTSPSATTSTTTSTTTPERVEPSRQRHPRRHPGKPTELRIHSLGVIAPVVPILAPDRTLVPPNDPQVLGWWAPGARPGVGRGSALITGHTVSTGGGALDNLGDVAVGALMEVRTPRLRMPYVVRKVRVYSKGRLSEDAARLFDQDTLGRLVVITCTDWNGSEYLSNVVVTAVPQHGRAYLAADPSRASRLAPNVLPIRKPR